MNWTKALAEALKENRMVCMLGSSKTQRRVFAQAELYMRAA